MTQLVQRAGLIQPPTDTPFPGTENDGTITAWSRQGRMKAKLIKQNTLNSGPLNSMSFICR